MLGPPIPTVKENKHQKCNCVQTGWPMVISAQETYPPTSIRPEMDN